MLVKTIVTSALWCVFLVKYVESFVLSEKCYWNNYCPYNYFSSKTFYDTIRGDIRDWNPNELKACAPIALWSLNRHGTRRAGKEVTEDMRAVSSLLREVLSAHDAGRGRLCSQDAENLRAWSSHPDLDDTMPYLTESGYEELQGIAKRLKGRYPELLSEYDANIFYFRPTSEQRTTMSSIAFVEGLFGDNSSATIDSPRDRDDVIRPYKNCERWEKDVDKSSQRLIQRNAYYETEDYKKVAEGIQDHTGIEYKLTPDNVTALFDLCRFKKSWNPETISPWCALFSAHDIAVLEYVDDLLHYYRSGYGSDLNPKLGATALKDLYETLDIVKTQNVSRVVAYFTHDTMMEMVFSAMGLFHDDSNLMANNRRPERKWRTSFISSFAVNLVATMYKCENGEDRVVFHLNERPVRVCSADWCSWEEFRAKFQRFVDTDLKFCEA